MPMQPGVVNAAHPDLEDQQDVASEPQGEPAGEGAPGGLPPEPRPITPGSQDPGMDAGLSPDQKGPSLTDDLSDDNAGGENIRGAEPMTPEEKQQFDAVMLTAYKIMYSATGFRVLLQKISRGADNIAQNIGHTVAMIMLSIQNGKRQDDGGKGYEPGVMFEAGVEVLQDVMRIAIGSGAVKEDRQSEVLSGAMMAAMKAYGDSELASGNITPEQQAQAMAELKSMGLDANQVGGVTPADKERATKLKAAAQLKKNAAAMTPEQMDAQREEMRQAEANPQQQPAGPAPQGAPAPGGIVNQATGA